MNLSVVNVNAKAMNEYTKYLLSLLEVISVPLKWDELNN